MRKCSCCRCWCLVSRTTPSFCMAVGVVEFSTPLVCKVFICFVRLYTAWLYTSFFFNSQNMLIHHHSNMEWSRLVSTRRLYPSIVNRISFVCTGPKVALILRKRGYRPAGKVSIPFPSSLAKSSHARAIMVDVKDLEGAIFMCQTYLWLLLKSELGFIYHCK